MPAKILVVDDEIVYLTRLFEQFFEEKIEKKEYEFLYAQDGLEALKKVEKEIPDLILTDIRMPRLDGLGFLHQLNEKKLNIKTVIISAYGTIDYLKQAMYERAYDFLIKPIDRSELENSIHRILLLSSNSQASQKNPPSSYKKKQNINYHSVLRLAKQLPLPQQLNLVSELIPEFPVSEIDNLEKNFPSFKELSQQQQAQKDFIAKEDAKRLKENRLSLSWLQECYLEVQKHPYRTSNGKRREYTYIYLRWVDPQTKKLKGRTLKKKELEDPLIRSIVEEKLGKSIDSL